MAGAYQPVSWTAQEFDDFGRVTRRTASDGTVVETVWSCCVKDFEIDAAGVTTDFTLYDGLHRLLNSTREAEQGDIITNYSYDASGRRLSETCHVRQSQSGQFKRIRSVRQNHQPDRQQESDHGV